MKTSYYLGLYLTASIVFFMSSIIVFFIIGINNDSVNFFVFILFVFLSIFWMVFFIIKNIQFKSLIKNGIKTVGIITKLELKIDYLQISYDYNTDKNQISDKFSICLLENKTKVRFLENVVGINELAVGLLINVVYLEKYSSKPYSIVTGL